jgi:hypothetical protein
MPVQANSKVKPKSSSKTLIGWGNFDSIAGMKLLVVSKKFFTNKSKGKNSLSKKTCTHIT